MAEFVSWEKMAKCLVAVNMTATCDFLIRLKWGYVTFSGMFKAFKTESSGATQICISKPSLRWTFTWVGPTPARPPACVLQRCLATTANPWRVPVIPSNKLWYSTHVCVGEPRRNVLKSLSLLSSCLYFQISSDNFVVKNLSGMKALLQWKCKSVPSQSEPARRNHAFLCVALHRGLLVAAVSGPFPASPVWGSTEK